MCRGVAHPYSSNKWSAQKSGCFVFGCAARRVLPRVLHQLKNAQGATLPAGLMAMYLVFLGIPQSRSCNCGARDLPCRPFLDSKRDVVVRVALHSPLEVLLTSA